MSSQDAGFERRIKQCLERSGCHVTKLRTIPPVTRTNPDGSTSEFSVEGTYDFLVLLRVPCTYHALPYALECKTAKEKRFDLGCVTTGQMKGLLDFRFVAGVVFESSVVHRCFFIPLTELRRPRTKKSISLRELGDCAVELPRNSTRPQTLDYYDMTPLLAGVEPKSAQGALDFPPRAVDFGAVVP